MPRCPSQDADRYFQDQELPENCPSCGKDNADPGTGDWLFEKGPFCSSTCRVAYEVQARKDADAYAAELENEKQLIREHNKNCPQCKTSPRYCPHNR